MFSWDCFYKQKGENMKKPNAMFGVAFLLSTRQFDLDVFFRTW